MSGQKPDRFNDDSSLKLRCWKSICWSCVEGHPKVWRLTVNSSYVFIFARHCSKTPDAV